MFNTEKLATFSMAIGLFSLLAVQVWNALIEKDCVMVSLRDEFLIGGHSRFYHSNDRVSLKHQMIATATQYCAEQGQSMALLNPHQLTHVNQLFRLALSVKFTCQKQD